MCASSVAIAAEQSSLAKFWAQMALGNIYSPPSGRSGLMLGLILGRKAGLTMELLDRLARFLWVRPLGSDFGREPVAGLMLEVMGDVTALASGVLRAVVLLEIAADPGVLSGPSLGVFLAEIRGVASPDKSGSILLEGVAAASGKIKSSILELLDIKFDMF